MIQNPLGTAMARKRVVIMGATGRDFHDFNVVFRDHSQIEVTESQFYPVRSLCQIKVGKLGQDIVAA